MSYLLNDMEKWAGDRETFQLSREELNRKIDMRNRTLWHDARDIEAGMMPPKEKIKPKFQTIKKRSFTHLAEDSDYADKHLEKNIDRRVRRQEFIMEKHRKINQAKQEARDKESEEMWASYERDLKKERRNQLIKPIALAGIAGAAAIGGGAYLYHRYKKKKRAQAEQEKTAASDDYYFENVNQFKKLMKAKPELAKRRFESWDFEDSDDYEAARSWHYNTFKASPEERKLLAERQRIKKQDKSMAEKTQEAYRSQHETNVKRAKRLENIGLGVGLGGAGLVGLSAYSKKLPEKYRMPLGLGGIGLVMGSMIPSGKGENLGNKSYEKYNQPMNDFNKRQEVRDSNIAYRKYLKNQNEHWAFGVDEEFEKLAALEEYYDNKEKAWKWRGTESDDERRERSYKAIQQEKYNNSIRKTRKVDAAALLGSGGSIAYSLKQLNNTHLDPKTAMRRNLVGIGLLSGSMVGLGYGQRLRDCAKDRYNEAMNEYYESNL